MFHPRGTDVWNLISQNGMFDGWSHFSKFPSWNPRHLGKVLKPRWLWPYSTKTTRCLLDTISCSVVAKNDKYHQISMDGAHFSKFPSWNPRHLGKVLKPRWLWPYSTKTTRCLLYTISCSVVTKNDKYYRISWVRAPDWCILLYHTAILVSSGAFPSIPL